MSSLHGRDDPHFCLNCGESLKGDPIPHDAIEKGFHPAKCRDCGGPNHWRLEIGHVENDRVVEWMCPHCGFRWPRR